MAGRIPPAFIDDLLARVDIVDIIDTRVPLKSAGKDHKARCPFHEERSASFTVSATKQFYHCFGCGAHGTALGFLMEYEGLGFREAVEELATRAGMTIPGAEAGNGAASEAPAVPTAPLIDALEEANRYFKAQLRGHEASEAAKTYLRNRGMSGETAGRFELGFAPPGWDNLCTHLGADDRTRKTLLDAGLANEKRGLYDRFRNRITFPIRNRRGQVVGFGARTIADEDPKYLNSPETPVFHKGRELYGLFEVRKHHRHPERVLVVEGYMDVVMLREHGVDYAVAALGTACTAEQILMLFRVTEHVVFCFDGDTAGRRAAWRALENTLAQIRDGCRASFLFLPDGEDPDSLIQSEGREAFEARIDEATSLSEYVLARLSEQCDVNSVEGRAELVKVARPLLASVSAPALKQLLGAEVARLCPRQQRAEILPLLGIAGVEGSTATAPGRRSRPAGRQNMVSPVRIALGLLVNHPSLAREAGPDFALEDDDLPGLGLLLDVVSLLREHEDIGTGMLIERFRDHPEGRHLGKLVDPEHELTAAQRKVYLDCLTHIGKEVDSRRFDWLRDKEDREGLTPEERREFAALAMQAKPSAVPTPDP